MNPVKITVMRFSDLPVGSRFWFPEAVGRIWRDAVDRSFVKMSDRSYARQDKDFHFPVGEAGTAVVLPKAECPYCGSFDTTRFEWAKQAGFEYWTCWKCDRSFAVWQAS